MTLAFHRFLLLCGLAAPVLWVGQILAAGLVLPGFNPVTHYISELGAQGAVTASWVRWGAFGLTGVLYVLFGLGELLTAGSGERRIKLVAVLLVLDGLGRLGAGIHACDAGCAGNSENQHWHAVWAVVGFVSGNLAALVHGAGSWKSGHVGEQKSARFALICGILAAVNLSLLKLTEGPDLPFGLFEHLASGVLSLWVFSYALSRRRRFLGQPA